MKSFKIVLLWLMAFVTSGMAQLKDIRISKYFILASATEMYMESFPVAPKLSPDQWGVVQINYTSEPAILTVLNAIRAQYGHLKENDETFTDGCAWMENGVLYTIYINQKEQHQKIPNSLLQ